MHPGRTFKLFFRQANETVLKKEENGDDEDGDKK